MPSTAKHQKGLTMTPSHILTLSLLWSYCHASGLRGPTQDAPRQLDLLDGSGGNKLDCSKELSFDIVCQGDCNFTSREGTCESKMFHYRGGSCRSATTARTNSDSAANCRDLHRGPPATAGSEVYAVISDAADPSKNSSMWTSVGGFFWTDYRDYPIGLGLSDRQNITIYASNETTYDNMLQTMIFHAPCEGTPLHQLDQGQSVQLIATAVDPKIRAHFELKIESLTQQEWNLQSVSVTSTVEPAYQELTLGDFGTTTVGSVSLPVVFEMDRNDTITVLGTAKLVTASGLVCGGSSLYTSNRSATAWP